MFATTVQSAGNWFAAVPTTFLALAIGRLGTVMISLAAAGLLAGIWMVSNGARRQQLTGFLFHHSDRHRRRSELRTLGLAITLGVFLALLIAACLYLLNVTNRL